MRLQLAHRELVLAQGRRHLGWKVGFGSPAAMKRFGTRAPLVGFMTDASLLDSGAVCSLAGWTRAMLEPEIAVHIGRDVAAGADAEQVSGAISGLGAAIELADLDAAVEGVEAILAGDIFHRHVILGPPDPGRAGGSVEGIDARVTRDGEEVASTSDLQANTGKLLDVLASVAATLAGLGEALSAGDVVIMGSVVPPIEVHAGESVRVAMVPIGILEVRFA